MQNISHQEIEAVVKEAHGKLFRGFVALDDGIRELIRKKGIEAGKNFVACLGDESGSSIWAFYLSQRSAPGAPKDYSFVDFALLLINDRKSRHVHLSGGEGSDPDR